VPDISSLDYVEGSAPSTPVYVVLFWAKYDKGGCEVFAPLNKLNSDLDQVDFLGISCDPQRAHVARFIEKNEFPCNFALAFDEGKKVFKAFKGMAQVPALNQPQAFVIKDGKVAWRQEFAQTFPVGKSNFEAQLKHVLAGEELEKAGNTPEVEEEESSEDGNVELGDDDDLALF